MLVFGGFNKCVISAEKLQTILNDFTHFSKWEVKDGINAFQVWVKPHSDSENTLKSIAKKFEELGALEIGYGEITLLSSAIIAEKDLHDIIGKLYLKRGGSLYTKTIDNTDTVYRVMSYSNNFIDGDAISKILLSLANRTGRTDITTFFKIVSDSSVEKFKKLINGVFTKSEFSYSFGELRTGEKWLEVATKSVSATAKIEKILEEI